VRAASAVEIGHRVRAGLNDKGVPSKAVSGRDELHAALEAAITSSKPELVEVPVTPGMALF
jgi:thiamine pyrophosphate-dependent acetolactate synthase large subunit-like protein